MRSSPERRSAPLLAALALAAVAPAGATAPARTAPPRALRVCDDVAPPASLDPRKQFAEKNYTLLQQIFGSLVRFGPDGRIEPSLAASWRRLDPMTVEFALRRGVRFHDGEPFDAEAVRFSLDALRDPKGGFPGAAFLAPIDRVVVVDSATVRVHTRFPDGILLNRLAGLAMMLPPRYIAEKGDEYFGRHPVGTGAFRFVRQEPRKIVLEANPDYWKGRPRFDGLEFLFLPVDEQVRGLLDSTVDIVTELPGTETLRVMRSGKARIVKQRTFYTVGSSVNVSSGPLADVRVRRAINYAIDKNALVRYDVLGNGEPLGSVSMPGEIGHDSSVEPYPYRPETARRLLREAGFGAGLRLSAVVKAQGERTMRVIASELEQVGVSVDEHLTTDATVIRDIQSRPWDFTFGGCPDPFAHSFFVEWIFLSSSSPYSVTRDAAFDRLFGQMVTTLDPAEQDRVGRRLDRLVHDEALGVFTYQRVKTYGVRNDVRFVPWVTGMPYFSASAPIEPTSAR